MNLTKEECLIILSLLGQQLNMSGLTEQGLNIAQASKTRKLIDSICDKLGNEVILTIEKEQKEKNNLKGTINI